MLVAQNIYKKYGNIPVLSGIDLQIEPAEMVSLVGSSGAGKTTLLHILSTLDQADTGSLYFEGASVFDFNEKQRTAWRNNSIGFIFQFHHLLPEFTALENVCIPAWIKGVSKTTAARQATELLHRLGLKSQANAQPNQLSGGEQQRVAVARALINKPKLIFADEPTGNLDSANALALHQLFNELKQELGCSFLIVTHNMELAALGDRTITLKNGRVEGAG